MRKSIHLIMGILLLFPFISLEAVPSYAKRSKFLGAVGGTCTRYSCSTLEGMNECVREDYGSPVRALYQLPKEHPNCYESFCKAYCLIPPEGEGESSRQKGKPTQSQIEHFKSLVERRCSGERNSALGDKLRKFCHDCESTNFAERHEYAISPACRLHPGETIPPPPSQKRRDSEDYRPRERGIIGLGKVVGQIGLGALQNHRFYAQGESLYGQAEGHYTQAQGHYNSFQEAPKRLKVQGLEYFEDKKQALQSHVIGQAQHLRNRGEEEIARRKTQFTKHVKESHAKGVGVAHSLQNHVARAGENLQEKIEVLLPLANR